MIIFFNMYAHLMFKLQNKIEILRSRINLTEKDNLSYISETQITEFLKLIKSLRNQINRSISEINRLKMDDDSNDSTFNTREEESRDDAKLKKRRRDLASESSPEMDRTKRTRRQTITVRKERLVKLDQLLNNNNLKSDKRVRLEAEKNFVVAYIEEYNNTHQSHTSNTHDKLLDLTNNNVKKNNKYQKVTNNSHNYLNISNLKSISNLDKTKNLLNQSKKLIRKSSRVQNQRKTIKLSAQSTEIAKTNNTSTPTLLVSNKRLRDNIVSKRLDLSKISSDKNSPSTNLLQQISEETSNQIAEDMSFKSGFNLNSNGFSYINSNKSTNMKNNETPPTPAASTATTSLSTPIVNNAKQYDELVNEAYAELFNYTNKFNGVNLVNEYSNQSKLMETLNDYLSEIKIDNVWITETIDRNSNMAQKSYVLHIKTFEQYPVDFIKIRDGNWFDKVFGGISLTTETPALLLYSSISPDIELDSDEVKSYFKEKKCTASRLQIGKPSCKIETFDINVWLELIKSGHRIPTKNNGSKFCPTHEWQFNIRFCPKCKKIGKHVCEGFYCILCSVKLRVANHDCRHNCQTCSQVSHKCDLKTYQCPTCKKSNHTLDKEGIKKCQYYNAELKFRNSKYNKILRMFNLEPDANNVRKSVPTLENNCIQDLKQSSLFNDLSNKVDQLESRQIKQGDDIAKIKKKTKGVNTYLRFLVDNHANKAKFDPQDISSDSE